MVADSFEVSAFLSVYTFRGEWELLVFRDEKVLTGVWYVVHVHVRVVDVVAVVVGGEYLGSVLDGFVLHFGLHCGMVWHSQCCRFFPITSFLGCSCVDQRSAV